MSKQRYQTGKAPHIAVTQCHGDLVIRGGEDPEVLVRGDDCEVEETKAGLTISSNGRLRLLVPSESSLTLSRISGDVVVKNVDGAAELDDVSGDAILVNVGNVNINTVHNDLSLKNINGPAVAQVVHGDIVARNVSSLAAKTIHGDLSGRLIDGYVQLGEVMGDINLRNVSGDLEIERGHRDANLHALGGQAVVPDIRGDIRIRGSLPEGEHSFKASGDIIVRWPEDVPLNVKVSASAITNRLQFDEVTESKGSFVGTMDGSQIHVTLSAEGQVVLKSIRVADEKWEWEQPDEGDFDFGVDLDDLGERISVQVNKQMARITSDLESRFGPEFSQKMAERISKKAEWAAAKAERAAEQAMRRAERSMRRMSQQAQRRRAANATRWTAPPPPKKKATSEEQLKILKMVEQGTITTEEASALLEALEQ